MSVPICPAEVPPVRSFVARRLAAAAGALVLAACAPVHVTPPVPTIYRCGGDVFWVGLTEEQASVTMPDGSLVTLDRLDAENEDRARRTFTDGRLTFVEEAGEAGEPRVLFARGRMAPVPCEPRG